MINKKKVFMLAAVLILIVFALAACGKPAQTNSGNQGTQEKTSKTTENVAQEKEFTGFLIDQACGVAGKDLGGNNIVEQPGKHTKDCAVVCNGSGYGISVKNDDGTYKYYKFDKKGSEIAAEIINKTGKKDNISISAKGADDGDTIKVSSIAEK